jgi:hypothetical protein
MSRINDALKRAQHQSPAPAVPPVIPPRAATIPTPPPQRKSSWLVLIWMIPAMLLMVLAVALAISWGRAHRLAEAPAVIVAAAPPAVAPPAVVPLAVVPLAVVPLAAGLPPPSSPPPPAIGLAHATPLLQNSPAVPKLQGIFYSPTTPSAILGGQTVRPGDTLESYRVKEITQNSVTLIRRDGKEILLSLGR